jgi:predicted kinase
MATLIILGGLPGTGKSTIARELSERMRATWLRIDTIEQALVDSGVAEEDIGGRGYILAYAIAAENLRCHQDVIADSVNPIALTRQAWRNVARETNSTMLEVEITCSDQEEHRRRVCERPCDIPNLRLPSWQEVVNRQYEPWQEANLRIDSARSSVQEAVEAILRQRTR